MYAIQSKLKKIRDDLDEILVNRSLQTATATNTIHTTTTTLDFLSLSPRSPWEECVLCKIKDLRPGINKGVYIDVTIPTLPAALTAILTCVQDSSGFVELSVYNWLPRAYLKTLRDLDWAMPKGAKIRIREPYLKQATLDPVTTMMLMMQNNYNPNIFIRVDNPSDIQFVSAPPDFKSKYQAEVDALLQRPCTDTLPSGLGKCSSDCVSGVEVRSSAFGEGLYSKTAIKKDALVFVEKVMVAAEGRLGHAFEMGKRSLSDINTYALYENLVFLDHCSGGLVYSTVVSRLFPANSDPDASMLINIHQVVESNSFGYRTSDEHKASSTRPRLNSQGENEKGGRSGLWKLASKMNHNCAPNTYMCVVDDMMYVYARHNVPAGTELTTKYFDIDAEQAPRTFGLRGQKRYFVCACASCVAREQVIHASTGNPEVSRFDRLDHQDTYLLRGPLFMRAEKLMDSNPEQALRMLFKLLMALREFEPGMEMTIQVYMAATETAILMRKVDLARTNIGLALQAYKRCFRASTAEFRQRFPYVASYPVMIQAVLVP
ncbi:hypothetical protein EMPS_04232 [Entomortierella parvispora]|uniref:SET domain-containing protein n=1 Tax=Entomortierella parvispora TaxID=205924 RepID=A0A9P3LVL7_9FUNG|nr:hypothetical protein EMPS_04232 [Entomortierella parvispora]